MNCSLLTCGVGDDRTFERTDYEAARARWCPGCGDHSVLTATQKLLATEQLKPERTVFVSGIGCSSRFPHYVKTYGFHGLHGRALPVATGVKLHRPDLDVFVVMGDGDCCSIGAAHWIHAIRYNLKMVVLLLDNNIYALTKKQTSPTTNLGVSSNTQPHGTYLPALNPLTATLGVTNASFVAQTAEWSPPHLEATLRAAFAHPGFAFVRILQRCPVYMPEQFTDAVADRTLVELLVHENGVNVPQLAPVYKAQRQHDPCDLHAARRLAEDEHPIRLGIFYQDRSKPRYEETRYRPMRTAQEKIALLEKEFDRYAV
ncbi:MAG TPA: thiamine pyrophosphate-dependent enzyme [Vicinamibacterales bacterium]|nr:thiamine pyrophosphate-dependent enzyme [Vicinamibacterales bacterium]